MKTATSSLLCALLLSGCVSLPLSDTTGGIDYARLYQAAWQLASPVVDDNVQGLTVLFGEETAQNAVKWYDATILALKAADALRTGTRSRDMRTQEVIAKYYADTH